jgi:arylsulfatase A-like enzyme
VLVILTDQFRWDCLGAFGNPQVRTPHLDGLAADAVRFPLSFCSLPVCTPSRYSLLTGLYVHQHGGWGNRSTLPPGIDTFAKALRRAGYRTRAVGKMHFTPTYLDAGFDDLELAEQNGAGRYDDDYHRELMANGLVNAVDLIDQEREFRGRAPRSYWEQFGAGRSDLPEQWHSTTWIGDRAVRALEGWTGSGNLLVASFVKPHHPFDPPAPWDSLYDPDELAPLPGWVDNLPEHDRAYQRGYFPNEALTPPVLRRVMAHYYATISQIDHHVGRMLDLLRRRGWYDDTMIVFTADHGEYLGFHHMLLKGGQMYDPLIRVPLLVKFPGNTAAGEARDTLVSNVDVAPSILAQAGVEPAAPLPGLNLADPAATRLFVFAENRRGAAYMARSRTHKLLLNRDPQHNLCFDLQQDPLELANRFDDPAAHAEVRRCRDALADWLLFQSVIPNYSDEQAPQIGRPNCPPPGTDHRVRLAAYFEQRVADYLARLGE